MFTLKEFGIKPQREHKESDDKDLSDLNPNVEQKEGHNNTLTKHHDFKVTREREAVNQAKCERDGVAEFNVCGPRCVIGSHYIEDRRDHDRQGNQCVHERGVCGDQLKRA